MKNISKILTFILLLFFTQKASAQKKDSLEFKAGFTAAPQGGINPKAIEEGSKFFNNLFPKISLYKGNKFAILFYSFTFNNTGLALGISPTKNTIVYVVGTKSSLVNDFYLGTGFGIPLTKTVTGFIEVGSNKSDKFSPKLYSGVFISFERKLSKH